MDSILIIVHLVAAVSLVSIVLLQQGKGADMGAAFGSGASQTVFGSSGSGSFLTRTTAILGTIFFVSSLSLAYFSGKANTADSVVDGSLVPTSIIAPSPVGDLPAVPEEAPVGDLPPE
ncbi:MAG: preprotein translocase subunit SecG [Gammaproteobacteria bacterium]|nr:preprotein translocase subunit SecG [Gammaproteobacteria bacterium]